MRDRLTSTGGSGGGGTYVRIRKELREIGLATLYFLICFGFFLGLEKLLLGEYDVETSVLGAAVIGALVVAKVVVLLEKTSFGGRFRSGPLYVHALWRSLAYTAAGFVVTPAEHPSSPGRCSTSTCWRSSWRW